MITPSTPVFVFDVESIGLHGQHFAVAGGVFIDSKETSSFCLACPPHKARGNVSDRTWVAENCPPIPFNCDDPMDVALTFLRTLSVVKAKHPDVLVFAECGFPVETTFLTYCHLVNDLKLPITSYPLHEIASFMAAAGMDPMATYDRLPNELPKHDPRADARQSARLLHEALVKLNKSTP